MKFYLVVNDSEMAQFVCTSPHVTPFVDLEHMGKQARQGHLETWKSRQVPEDVTKIRQAVPEADLLVRINPLHDGSAAELDDVIARGADIVMLPMFYTYDQLARFYDLLNGRAKALPLFETASSVQEIPSLLGKLPIDALHIGMNDLHLDLGASFLFEPLADGYLETAGHALREANTVFGIGGIARSREGIVSPEYLLGEHVRLGSQATILSQTFHRGQSDLAGLQREMDFHAELEKLLDIYEGFQKAGADALERNRIDTRNRIHEVVHLIKSKKG